MNTQIRRGWQFFREVIEKYVEHECTLRAASLAYYALFSIFPLLLFLVYLGSWLLTSESARGTLDLYVQRVFPVSAEDIRAVVDQTMRARGPIGIVGAVGLFWSASSVFGVLEWSLSVIWDGTPSPFWRTRLLASVSVLALSAFFIVSFFLRPLVDWLWADDGIVYKDWLNIVVGIGAGTVISLLLFRIFPNRDVAWRPALAGAVLVAVSIEVMQSIFGYYLGLAFKNFGYIYGSLAWVVALAFWVYIASLIFFFGAEFGATLDRRGLLYPPPSRD